MVDFVGAGVGATTSVLGTANPVIYTAAVVLSGAGVGLADTGSLGLTDREHAAAGAGAGNGGAAAGALAGAGIYGAGPTGDTLLGFAHANLDPHTQPTVGLVGAVLHNLGVG